MPNWFSIAVKKKNTGQNNRIKRKLHSKTLRGSSNTWAKKEEKQEPRRGRGTRNKRVKKKRGGSNSKVSVMQVGEGKTKEVRKTLKTRPRGGSNLLKLNFKSRRLA